MKNNKFINAIIVILVLLVFSTQFAFIIAQDNALKGKLTVAAGLLLLILVVLVIFLSVQRRNSQNPKEAKLKTAAPIIFLLWGVLMSASVFVQDNSLRENLFIVETLIFFIGLYINYKNS